MFERSGGILCFIQIPSQFLLPLSGRGGTSQRYRNLKERQSSNKSSPQFLTKNFAYPKRQKWHMFTPTETFWHCYIPKSISQRFFTITLRSEATVQRGKDFMFEPGARLSVRKSTAFQRGFCAEIKIKWRNWLFLEHALRSLATTSIRKIVEVKH